MKVLRSGKFVDGLKQALQRGDLIFHGSLKPLSRNDVFHAFLQPPPFRHDWVVYAKRRFLLHIVQRGFVRIRCFGFLANPRRASPLPLFGSYSHSVHDNQQSRHRQRTATFPLAVSAGAAPWLSSHGDRGGHGDGRLPLRNFLKFWLLSSGAPESGIGCWDISLPFQTLFCAVSMGGKAPPFRPLGLLQRFHSD